MLVLTRKLDQEILIGENVRVTVLEIKGDRVKLGFVAPREVPILRQEVHLAIQAEDAADAALELVACHS